MVWSADSGQPPSGWLPSSFLSTGSSYGVQEEEHSGSKIFVVGWTLVNIGVHTRGFYYRGATSTNKRDGIVNAGRFVPGGDALEACW